MKVPIISRTLPEALNLATRSKKRPPGVLFSLEQLGHSIQITRPPSADTVVKRGIPPEVFIG